MSRPQKFNPSIGMQGNIENLLWQNQYRQNDIYNEISNRSIADEENRTSVEQAMTELDLMQISAEQSITDLDLRVMELEE